MKFEFFTLSRHFSGMSLVVEHEFFLMKYLDLRCETFLWKENCILINMLQYKEIRWSNWTPVFLSWIYLSENEIEGLVTSRVHLAIPEKSVFARASTPPSASVFIQMENGRS